MKILITGINGFAGSHLVEFLSKQPDVEVAGIDIIAPPSALFKSMGSGAPSVHCCDLGDHRELTGIIEQESPDAVVHLAARAQVAGAWEKAAAIMETNVVCTQVLMQAIHEIAPGCRVLLISSSEVYGKTAPEELPISEQSPLKPNNPYSSSKAAQEFVGWQYHAAFGTPVVIARPFNHIGPRQVGNFVVASFARQIAEMEAGRVEPILRVGNLETSRDFTDVRDIVRAYFLILTQGQPGERYNVCSGESHKISDILKMLLEISSIDPEIQPIPELMRPADLPVVTGDYSKLRSLGDWRPSISLGQSLKDTLDYWRKEVGVH